MIIRDMKGTVTEAFICLSCKYVCVRKWSINYVQYTNVYGIFTFSPFMVSLHSYPVDILWYIQSIPFDDSCQTS